VAVITVPSLLIVSTEVLTPMKSEAVYVTRDIAVGVYGWKGTHPWVICLLH
jgi:hypothetical protein